MLPGQAIIARRLHMLRSAVGAVLFGAVLALASAPALAQPVPGTLTQSGAGPLSSQNAPDDTAGRSGYEQASVPPATQSMGAPVNDAGYVLGNGDHVHVTVFGQKEMTGDYQVDGQGRIAFPLIGQVQAGGMSTGQLQQKIAAALTPDYIKDPHVSVEVLTYRPFYVIGEVTKPGSYPYVSGMTALNAIALAGGFTYRADQDTFEVTRYAKSGTSQHLKVKPDTPVQPGDVITVDESIF